MSVQFTSSSSSFFSGYLIFFFTGGKTYVSFFMVDVSFFISSKSIEFFRIDFLGTDVKVLIAFILLIVFDQNVFFCDLSGAASSSKVTPLLSFFKIKFN
jgi:hypothetical protein